MQAGEGVLVQATAGGVGSLAVQLCRLAGARPVLGTFGSEDTRRAVRDLGADVAIDYTGPDWPAEVRAATGRRGVDVVLDAARGLSGASVPKACAPPGRMVTFANASGQPLPVGELMMPLAVEGLSLVGFGGPWLRPERSAAWEALVAEVGAGRHPEQQRPSARNLPHYLALRVHDRRPLLGAWRGAARPGSADPRAMC